MNGVHGGKGKGGKGKGSGSNALLHNDVFKSIYLPTQSSFRINGSTEIAQRLTTDTFNLPCPGGFMTTTVSELEDNLHKYYNDLIPHPMALVVPAKIGVIRAKDQDGLFDSFR